MSVSPGPKSSTPLFQGGRPAPWIYPLSLLQNPNWGDRLFRGLCQGAAILIVLLFALLVGVIFENSWLSIRTTGLGFFTSATWDPEPSHHVFGALAFIYGTVVTSALAMLV